MTTPNSDDTSPLETSPLDTSGTGTSHTGASHTDRGRPGNTPTSLSQFLSGAAARGPVAGLLTSPLRKALQVDDPGGDTVDRDTVDRTTMDRDTMDRDAVVVVDATSMTTVDGLMDAFARAWDFPPYFGHNRDAFDECMRELQPNGARRLLLTHITHASSLLSEDPDQLGWFVDSLQFYRRHYRDIADEPSTFAVLLSTDPETRDDVESRWAAVNVPLPEVNPAIGA